MNQLARSTTNQVRSVTMVTNAVALGDLTKQVELNARCDIQELQETVNDMSTCLGAFADEIVELARGAGIDARLDGLAQAGHLDGIWVELAEIVKEMAVRVSQDWIFTSRT